MSIKNNPFKDLIKLGNMKIAENTMIFNMGSATRCPSRKLGMCKVCKQCYAYKAERLYPGVRAYRDRQRKVWDKYSVNDLVGYFSEWVEWKRSLGHEIKYFRYNESGDFKNFNDVQKLDHIASNLREHYGIKTFGYTARHDLFENKPYQMLSFTVKLSGYIENGHAFTTVLDKQLKPIDKEFLKVLRGYIVFTPMKAILPIKKGINPYVIVCPAQVAKLRGSKPIQCMKDCTFCTARNINVAFIKH